MVAVPTIDVHSHYVPRGWPDLAVAAGGGEGWPWASFLSQPARRQLLGGNAMNFLGRVTSGSSG